MEDGFDGVYDERFEISEEFLDEEIKEIADSRFLDEYVEGKEPEDVDIESLLDIGIEYISINRFEQAIETFERILHIESENQEAWINKGHAHAEIGEYERAIGAYKEALRIDDSNREASKALINLSYAEYEKGTGNPLEKANKALRVDERMPEAWYNKSFFLNQEGRHEEALRCAENAISLGFREATEEKIKALEELGRHEEAEKIRKREMEREKERERMRG